MTPELRRDTRWWGWGDPAESTELSVRAERLLAERGIEVSESRRIRPLTEVELPEAEALPGALLDVAGTSNVSTSHEDRLRHSGGQSYADLIERRSGVLSIAPDAVVAIDSPDRIVHLLEACSRHGVAVVPFGGGTSVVGGVVPGRGRCGSVISLDTGRLRSVRVDRTSQTATLGAGLRGPEAESALAEHGFTLGHFPQSFEYATIGGFAATRSAGQASNGYGRFDTLVSSIRLATPSGMLSTLETPHTAIGPSLMDLVVGSEGAFGVIPDVTVRVRPIPAVRRYEAWFAGDFDTGSELTRSLAQADCLPAVVRVSDPTETAVSLGISGPSGISGDLLKRYLKLRGREGGSLIIVGFEGSEAGVRHQRRRVVRTLRSGGAVALGQAAGSGWLTKRFHGPYLREALLDRGLVVDTLETAQQWSHHGELYEAVRVAIQGELDVLGMNGVVMCHLSHAYRDGASLYFTVIASPGPDGGLSSWQRIKLAACSAMQAGGGTLSHHHATGRDHQPYLQAEIGALGVETLRAVKSQLDPNGIMNPGCLVP
ncbi:MAG: FAD-binding oxidoreductase [Solirubrobacterales bacterium]